MVSVMTLNILSFSSQIRHMQSGTVFHQRPPQDLHAYTTQTLLQIFHDRQVQLSEKYGHNSGLDEFSIYTSFTLDRFDCRENTHNNSPP